MKNNQVEVATQNQNEEATLNAVAGNLDATSIENLFDIEIANVAFTTTEPR